MITVCAEGGLLIPWHKSNTKLDHLESASSISRVATLSDAVEKLDMSRLYSVILRHRIGRIVHDLLRGLDIEYRVAYSNFHVLLASIICHLIQTLRLLQLHGTGADIERGERKIDVYFQAGIVQSAS